MEHLQPNKRWQKQLNMTQIESIILLEKETALGNCLRGLDIAVCGREAEMRFRIHIEMATPKKRPRVMPDRKTNDRKRLHYAERKLNGYAVALAESDQAAKRPHLSFCAVPATTLRVEPLTPRQQQPQAYGAAYPPALVPTVV